MFSRYIAYAIVKVLREPPGHGPAGLSWPLTDRFPWRRGDSNP